MCLFFEWIINKQKDNELRRGKARKGDEAVLARAQSMIQHSFIQSAPTTT